jgi:hypothetical protein
MYPSRRMLIERTSQNIDVRVVKYYKSTRTDCSRIHHLKSASSSLGKNVKTNAKPLPIKQHFFIPPQSILKREQQEILGVKPLKFADYVKKHLLSYDQYHNKYSNTYDDKTLKTGYELYCIASYNGYLHSLEFANSNIL